MIAYLTGQILEISDSSITLLTSGGIGYEVGINEISYASLATSENASLYIYHHITEGGQSLFGFETGEEKKLFTELIKISGVGGKVALQIMSLGKTRLIESVRNDDKKTIESIKGIGKKMAEKIILELKDKEFVKSYEILSEQKSPKELQIELPVNIIENITSTLQNMGYQRRDIERVLSNIPESLTTLEDILPYMIRELS